VNFGLVWFCSKRDRSQQSAMEVKDLANQNLLIQLTRSVARDSLSDRNAIEAISVEVKCQVLIAKLWRLRLHSHHLAAW
jgi:hypothetical protein